MAFYNNQTIKKENNSAGFLVDFLGMEIDFGLFPAQFFGKLQFRKFSSKTRDTGTGNFKLLLLQLRTREVSTAVKLNSTQREEKCHSRY